MGVASKQNQTFCQQQQFQGINSFLPRTDQSGGSERKCEPNVNQVGIWQLYSMNVVLSKYVASFRLESPRTWLVSWWMDMDDEDRVRLQPPAGTSSVYLIDSADPSHAGPPSRCLWEHIFTRPGCFPALRRIFSPVWLTSCPASMSLSV